MQLSHNSLHMHVIYQNVTCICTVGKEEGKEEKKESIPTAPGGFGGFSNKPGSAQGKRPLPNVKTYFYAGTEVSNKKSLHVTTHSYQYNTYKAVSLSKISVALPFVHFHT